MSVPRRRLATIHKQVPLFKTNRRRGALMELPRCAGGGYFIERHCKRRASNLENRMARLPLLAEKERKTDAA